jgi:hypothetical protein
VIYCNKSEPYQARFVNDFQNLISRSVDYPKIISKYFLLRSNGIDKYNQACQFEFRLEKHWKTQNAWFCLVTTIKGISMAEIGRDTAVHLEAKE